jgi:DNA adenine methylase
MSITPSAPALRYHGAKWQLAAWILRNFPPHECYVEPFGGSAAVLLQKPRSWLEVYNDLSHELCNFFRVLREQPETLIHRIEFTPYAFEEWRLSYEDDPDPVERARRFYVRAYMAIAGPTAQWNTGWRRQKVITRQRNLKRMTPAAIIFMRTEHLYEVAQRLRGVQIECDKAAVVIARYDSPVTLFYVDPPYPAATRGRWSTTAYEFELDDAAHEALAGQLHQVAGMAVISGYRCELYDRIYADWRRLDITARVNGPGSAVESLWLSPKTVHALRDALPLFTMEE